MNFVSHRSQMPEAICY